MKYTLNLVKTLLLVPYVVRCMKNTGPEVGALAGQQKETQIAAVSQSSAEVLARQDAARLQKIEEQRELVLASEMIELLAMREVEAQRMKRRQELLGLEKAIEAKVISDRKETESEIARKEFKDAREVLRNKKIDVTGLSKEEKEKIIKGISLAQEVDIKKADKESLLKELIMNQKESEADIAEIQLTRLERLQELASAQLRVIEASEDEKKEAVKNLEAAKAELEKLEAEESIKRKIETQIVKTETQIVEVELAVAEYTRVKKILEKSKEESEELRVALKDVAEADIRVRNVIGSK